MNIKDRGSESARIEDQVTDKMNIKDPGSVRMRIKSQ